MKYVSTRGAAPVLGFADALLAGLARDGGLYVPETVPTLPIALLHPGAGYAENAVEVIWPFVEGSIDRHDLERLTTEAYAGFHHRAVCPLRQIGDDDWLLELFHGPTLAFKDVALQLVGRLMDHELARRGERLTIVVATSGDTGSAAIEACRDRANVDVFVLFPDGRVSDVQRRQMTTVDAPNVHNLAVRGTFDDCQDLVKALFADEPFRDRMHLGALNSINWARVVAQVVYYVTAGLSLSGRPLTRTLSFTVPTGNFGNIYAGWVARAMGLPVDRLVIASNANDILPRFIHSGLMVTTVVQPTTSPSMDIQVSSNFERLLFEANGRDGGMTADQMRQFKVTGSLAVEPDQLDEIRAVFTAARVDDAAAAAVMAETYAAAGVLVDPHTAVGLGAATLCRGDRDTPMVTLATAHPAKFPEAVEAATGVRPELPPFLADLLSRPERFTVVDRDLDVVRRHIAERAGAGDDD